MQHLWALTKEIGEETAKAAHTSKGRRVIKQLQTTIKRMLRPGASYIDRPGASHKKQPGATHINRPGAGHIDRPGAARTRQRVETEKEWQLWHDV